MPDPPQPLTPGQKAAKTRKRRAAARKAAATRKRRATGQKAAATRRRNGESALATTRISTKHQVTIPVKAFNGAALEAGDTLHAEARGAGRIVLTRVTELVDRYSGALDTGGALRDQVETLRDEWR
ncbi:MAG: hypothetical protein ACR2G3_11670 [Solirubrobacterales bacterium]